MTKLNEACLQQASFFLGWLQTWRPLINVNLAGGHQRNTRNHAMLAHQSVVELYVRRDSSAAAAASTYE